MDLERVDEELSKPLRLVLEPLDQEVPGNVPLDLGDVFLLGQEQLEILQILYVWVDELDKFRISMHVELNVILYVFLHGVDVNFTVVLAF